MMAWLRAQSLGPGGAAALPRLGPLLTNTLRMLWGTDQHLTLTGSSGRCRCLSFGTAPASVLGPFRLQGANAIAIDTDLPQMRSSGHRDHANRRLPVLLWLPGLRNTVKAEARWLLRVLLIWVSAMSANTRTRQGGLLWLEPHSPRFGCRPLAISEVAARLVDVRYVGYSRLDLLTLSSSHLDR